MSETIYHRYRLKRRTTAGWAANNEVLLAGEPGIEVLVDGTERIKYGDGVKTWAQLSYAAGGGGGAALSNATPQALGTAAAGTSAEASRADHRHQLPTAGDVGADASGTAAAAVAAHAAAADPHPGYALETDARLSDARPPTAHKSTHATGGTDALSPADIGAATAAQGEKADSAVQPGAIGSSGLTMTAGRVLIGPETGTGAPREATLAPDLIIDGTVIRALRDILIPLSDEATALSTGVRLTVPYWPKAMALTELPIWMLGTAPTGAALQLDIRVGGTSIFSTLPTIAAGSTSSVGGTPAVFATAFVSSGQQISAGASVTFHVLQVGSTVAGAGLKVALATRRAS